jgi:Family of unknown function (DUF5941)/CDP-alcohol phosphatidyltransferase
VSEVSDDAATRLAAAVKADDGFFTTYCVSSYTPHLVRAAARLRLTPNLVTSASLVVAAGAAVSFGSGSRAALVAGAVLLQVSFTLDVVDGQLARYTGASSAFGAWFDALSDRVKEYAVYAGLAVGSVRAFHDDVWALAGAALVLQTVRHQIDFGFAPASPPADIDDGPPAGLGARLGHGAIRLSATTNRRGVTYWAKRIIVLPIGERLLLISVTAAFFRPRVTFVALLVWGALALAYSLAGRVLRSLARTAERASRAPGLALALVATVPWFVALALTDFGGRPWPLVVALGWLLVWGIASDRVRVRGRLDWLVAPLLLAAEGVGVLRLAAVASDRDLAAGFALTAVIVIRRYDVIYRGALTPPTRWIALLADHWELRLTLATVLAVVGVVTPGYYLAAGVLAALLGCDAVLTWHDRDKRRGAPAVAAAEELH